MNRFTRILSIIALFFLTGLVSNFNFILRFNSRMWIRPMTKETFLHGIWIDSWIGKRRDPENKVLSFSQAYTSGNYLKQGVVLLKGRLFEDFNWHVWKSMTILKRNTSITIYKITWFNPPFDFLIWPKAVYSGFKSCKYNNCILNFGKTEANESDAVIFDGRKVKPRDFFQKKFRQIWIYSTIEPPTHLKFGGAHWTKGNWASSFNWTMSYDKSNNDIYLPYGEIRKKDVQPKQVNYSEIFRMKNKTALIIHSNCNPPSARGKFVKLLKKYLDIDVLGLCGKSWNCGQLYQHDDCFKIINKYKFYLAFENSFCNQYFTEKIYRNFNYDSLMVIRGGRNNDTKRIFPPGTYISTEDFHSIKDLANYLNKVGKSEELYIKFLKQKSYYYSIPYEIVYQRAMCQLCEKMNNQEEYRNENRNIKKWAYGNEVCQKAQDLNET